MQETDESEAIFAPINRNVRFAAKISANFGNLQNVYVHSLVFEKLAKKLSNSIKTN